MIDYSSTKTAAEKFAALKEAAGKKPVPRINPNIYYYFSNKFLHFLDTNKYYTLDTYISTIANKSGKLITNGFPATLIDIGENSDMISYIETDKLIKMFQDDNTYTEKTNNSFIKWFSDNYNKSDFWKQHRTEIKAGRFLKKIYNYEDKICEEFANLYKSYNDSFNYEFVIVGNTEIIKYYNKDNYDIKNQNSSLSKSCMAFSSADDEYMKRNGSATFKDRLKFYSLNTNCGLLILRHKGSKKIKGRCLVWKTINNDIYMDRVYVDFESDYFLYKKYATDNSFYSHSLGNKPINMEIELNEEIKNIYGREAVKRQSTPYLDSFHYDYINNRLIRK